MKKGNIYVQGLAHTKWECKYHIVFAPKYRKKVFYEEKRLEIREIIGKLCEWKGVEIVEGEVCPDHIYVDKNPAQNERFGVYGISKRKKCIANFSKMRKHEICIPKSGILV